MTTTRMLGCVGAVVLVSTCGLSVLLAQQNQGSRENAGKNDQGDQVTLTGQLVDLAEYMMRGAGAMPEHRNPHASGMQVGTANAGQIKALVSDRGLVILGNGNPQLDRIETQSGTMAGQAGKSGKEQVQVSGKLYQRDGVKFLDVQSAKPVGESHSASPRPKQP